MDEHIHCRHLASQLYLSFGHDAYMSWEPPHSLENRISCHKWGLPFMDSHVRTHIITLSMSLPTSSQKTWITGFASTAIPFKKTWPYIQSRKSWQITYCHQRWPSESTSSSLFTVPPRQQWRLICYTSSTYVLTMMSRYPRKWIPCSLLATLSLVILSSLANRQSRSLEPTTSEGQYSDT